MEKLVSTKLRTQQHTTPAKDTSTWTMGVLSRTRPLPSNNKPQQEQYTGDQLKGNLRLRSRMFFFGHFFTESRSVLVCASIVDEDVKLLNSIGTWDTSKGLICFCNFIILSANFSKFPKPTRSIQRLELVLEKSSQPHRGRKPITCQETTSQGKWRGRS